jgi:stress-induced morphogen
MSLRQRAHRYDWHKLKTEALAMVSQVVTNHTGKTLIQRSSEVRSALADEVNESVSALSQTTLKPNLAHLGERVDVTQKLVGAVSKVYGWNTETEIPLVVVGMMRAALELDAEVELTT